MSCPYGTIRMPSSTTRRRAAKERSRKKSRTGCKNCKLRSVKCDEFHPQCKRCIGYGVLCNYEQAYDELQVCAEGVATIISVPDPALRFLSWSDKYDGLLHKFRTRTAMTISTGRRLLVFQGEVMRLTNANSFLKHAVCALTLLHDQYLEQIHSTPLSKPVAYHWYLATAIFNKELSRATAARVDIEKQVSLWCTAALLGQLTFYYVEAPYHEDCWPLKDNPKTDLNWLKMSHGKTEVAKLAEGISSHPRYSDLYNIPLADIDPGRVSVLPIPVKTLDQFDGLMYKAKADDLREVLGSNCLVTVVLSFWNSVHNASSSFTNELDQKKPKALALLLLWFTKLHQLPIWWLKRRTLLEGRAICIYLENFHKGDMRLQSLLSWPKEVLFSCRCCQKDS